MVVSRGILCLLILSAVFNLSCSKTNSGPEPVSLELIWPHGEGYQWTFALVSRDWPEALIGSKRHYYRDRDSVPRAPSLDEVAKLVDARIPSLNHRDKSAVYELRFSHSQSDDSGASTGVLDAWFAETSQPGVLEPEILTSGFWRRSNDWIELQTRAGDYWRLLEQPLLPGYETAVSLGNSDEGREIIRVWIRQRVSITTPVGAFEGALECVYLRDFLEFHPPAAETGGRWSRTFTYGTIIYAPAVGPVFGYERQSVDAGDPDYWGTGDITMIVTRTEDAAS